MMIYNTEIDTSDQAQQHPPFLSFLLFSALAPPSFIGPAPLPTASFFDD